MTVLVIMLLNMSITKNAKPASIVRSIIAPKVETVTRSTPNYSVAEPKWPVVDKSEIGNRLITKAFAADKCTYFLAEQPNTTNRTVKYFFDILDTNPVANLVAKVDKKEYKDNQVYLEGGMNSVGQEYYAAVKGFFLEKNNTFYMMVFESEKKDFDQYCRPYIDNTFNSFKLLQ